jgi:hypothetical protein
LQGDVARVSGVVHVHPRHGLHQGLADGLGIVSEPQVEHGVVDGVLELEDVLLELVTSLDPLLVLLVLILELGGLAEHPLDVLWL